MFKEKKLTIITIIILILIIIVSFIILFSINLSKKEKDNENKELLKEYSLKNISSIYNSFYLINNKLIKCQYADRNNLYNCSIDNSSNKYCFVDNEFIKCKKIETLIDKIKNNLNIDKTKNKYIFKGNNVNNYFWYHGFMWRILEFDNDSLTLISDSSISNIKSDKIWKNLGDYKNSYINYWLNDYFYNLLSDYFKNYILLNKYNIGLYSDVDNLQIKSKIGLLDEEQYNIAGGSNSYLNINDNFLLGNRYNDNYLRIVNYKGIIDNGVENIVGIRPVIKIDNLVNVKGDGSKENFYYLEDNEINVGEYVDLKSSYCNGLCKFRIINHDNNKYKLILNDLIDISNYDNSLKILETFKNKTPKVTFSELPRISELFTSNDINLNKDSLSNWFWTLKNNDIYYAVNNDGLINRVDKNFAIGIRPIVYIDDNINFKGMGTYNNSYTIE